jgi:UDP-N-acetylmuramoyl-tripeptide--D-alanyl-D-alanine ligase
VRFTTSEIAGVTDGEVFGREATVEGATIDSRSVRGGELFVPIVAERDGHDFIGAAVAAGAPAYLTSGPIEAATAIRVPDTFAALQQLGAHARDRLPDRVVGVTGSVGKTSLKDLLGAVGATTWTTHVPAGSFNNEMGVPLTLANAPDETELTVVEMGARGPGHVADLCAIARPSVGVVTVVAGAHLEQFGDLEGVARAKGELIEALPADGTAVLNADDPRVAAMAERSRARVVTFGVHGGDVRAHDVQLDQDLRARFVVRSPWGEVAVHLGVAGEHQVTNALGAAAAALSLGVTLDAVAEGLAGARLSAMRMDLRTLPSGARLLDDSYNANPTSTLAALRSLQALDVSRRVAVLGTMAELGPDSAAAHRRIAADAAALGIEVVAVADDGYGSSATLVPDVAAAVDWLRAHGLGPDVAVLVKASRSAGLDRVVAGLQAGEGTGSTGA